MQQNDCDRQQFINKLKKITGMALNKVQGICMLSFHIHITR